MESQTSHSQSNQGENCDSSTTTVNTPLWSVTHSTVDCPPDNEPEEPDDEPDEPDDEPEEPDDEPEEPDDEPDEDYDDDSDELDDDVDG
ncbi:hypothetical protein [Sphaerospermopsis torques-reginae]|uniref:Uncharacterized protein n=1 Tax=Sphaerospermopsis torques-reginae ITEP-024 TaxID=984208 RepID=A0ABX8WVT4_9CYAN|nr:hypothetical protein [Sphaerospermopsis torques-reginae]QYX30522.1 hypothetical protein K2F26_16690 [Sphaerospermopsis torques-reginae ITEP-024]